MEMIDLFGDGKCYVSKENMVSIYVRDVEDKKEFGVKIKFIVEVDYNRGDCVSTFRHGCETIDEADEIALILAKKCNNGN